jgi:isopenicillin N synthase-like dioxygenase
MRWWHVVGGIAGGINGDIVERQLALHTMEGCTMPSENAIPTIDLTALRTGGDPGRRDVARLIDEACRDTGFFLVTGHGVPAELISKARQRAIDFFALPDDEKMKVQRPPAKISRGYNWVGDRSIAYSMGQAAPPDIQEAFGFGQDRPDLASKVDKASAQMYAPNIWPERPHDFKQTMLSYYDAMMGLASDVLRAMATALDVSENYFADKFDRQASVCRIIRYPTVTQPPLPGQLRAGTHTDYGIMTFVRGDDTPGGLQVRHRNGSWIDVHIPRDGFCCNIGDLMARWSNDRWVSTLHRVAVPPPDAVPQDRISLVFFTNPNPDAEIRCLDNCVRPGETPKYPPITVSEHYLGKLMRAGHSRVDAKAADALTH